jgi:hypothetical protein
MLRSEGDTHMGFIALFLIVAGILLRDAGERQRAAKIRRALR